MIDFYTPSERLKEYGHRVKMHRVQAKMTQADLAKQVGVNQDSISRLERGENVSLLLFLKILAVLGVDREILLSPEVFTLKDLLKSGTEARQRYRPSHERNQKRSSRLLP